MKNHYLKAYTDLCVFNLLTKNKTFFLCYTTNKSPEQHALFQRQLEKLGVTYRKLTKSSVKAVFKKSVFKNYSSLASGPVGYILPATNKDLDFTKLINNVSNNTTPFFCKLNNKLYDINPMSNLKNSKYTLEGAGFTAVLSSSLKSMKKFQVLLNADRNLRNDKI